MASKHSRSQSPINEVETVPFESAEEAWFWFVAAQLAKDDGARIMAGAGLCPRPCEPLDILKVLDGLHRKRRLIRDHVLVLRHYGRRYLPPDPYVVKEARAYTLWTEALDRMEPILERKGIVRKPHWTAGAYDEEDSYEEVAEADLDTHPKIPVGIVYAQSHTNMRGGYSS